MNIDINTSGENAPFHENTSILVDGCNSLGLSLTKTQIRQYVLYYRMLYEKNRVMNLTTVTEWSEVQTKHYLDSLLISRVTDLTGKLNVLDMGTGAGFPGIPLKIAFPDLNMVLADSLNKRIRFLEEVIAELGLTGIRAVHGRAEDLGRQPEYREEFDLVVSRAVAPLSSLSEYCIPFVKMHGVFISYKSSEIEEEVKNAEKAIRILGGGKPSTTALSLPCTDMNRSFVVVRKEKSTPGKYPRKAGTPKRDPLK